MSLILGYANKDNAIIMSDGRAGENGSLSEHYNKTRKINDNIIIGFAGFAEPIEIFLNHTISQMDTKRYEYYIEDYWELMQFLLDDVEAQKHLKSTFIILGRDRKHRMHSSIIGHTTNYKLDKQIVSAPRVTSIGGTIAGKIIEEIYMRNIKQYHLPIEDCMRATIQEVSKLDSSVNANCSVVAI